MGLIGTSVLHPAHSCLQLEGLRSSSLLNHRQAAVSPPNSSDPEQGHWVLVPEHLEKSVAVLAWC